MYTDIHLKYPLFLSDLMELEFSEQIFLQILKYHISQKSVQWKPSCSMWMDGQMERHDRANSHFYNTENTPNEEWKNLMLIFQV